MNTKTSAKKLAKKVYGLKLTTLAFMILDNVIMEYGEPISNAAVNAAFIAGRTADEAICLIAPLAKAIYVERTKLNGRK